MDFIRLMLWRKLNLHLLDIQLEFYKSFGIPELFISGLPNGLTTELIKNYAERFKFKKVPVNQKIDDLIDRFSCLLY